MRPRWPLAAVPLGALLVGWALLPVGRPPEPERAPVEARARPAAAASPPDDAPVAATTAAPSTEPRREVARELPAEGTIGRMVQAAMSRPGDSDPRLLDLLARVGAAPSALAAVGAAVDPWLAVGLVDLERQVARRCAREGDAEACWATALEAEEEVAALLADPDAAEALARFREADARSASGGGGVRSPPRDAR